MEKVKLFITNYKIGELERILLYNNIQCEYIERIDSDVILYGILGV